MFSRTNSVFDPCVARSKGRVAYMALTILREGIILGRSGAKTVTKQELRECFSGGEHLWMQELPSMTSLSFEEKKFCVMGLKSKYQKWEAEGTYKKWILWKNECIKLTQIV